MEFKPHRCPHTAAFVLRSSGFDEVMRDVMPGNTWWVHGWSQVLSLKDAWARFEAGLPPVTREEAEKLYRLYPR